MDSMCTAAWSPPLKSFENSQTDGDEKNPYRPSFAYEIPGFYSDDEDNEEDQRLATHRHEEPHVSMSFVDQQLPPTGRKRSMTNAFTSKAPRTTHNPAQEYLNALSSGMPSDLAQKQIGNSSHTLPYKSSSNQSHLSKQAKNTLSRKANTHAYLSHARKILTARTNCPLIILGHQPIRTTMTLREQNDFSQKIWLHQMNRSEVYQKVGLNFEVIPEEEECSSATIQ